MQPGQWIVARTAHLWVVVRIDAETFDFVAAVPPTVGQDELAPWVCEPEDDD